MLFVKFFYFWFLFKNVWCFTIHNTQRIREKELMTEASMRLGANLTSQFTENEKMANELILKLHKQSIEDGIKDIHNFPAAMHFFKAKPLIDKSRMFKIIQKMPKGAFLHGHNSAMVMADWMLQNITYQPGIKFCKNEIDLVLLTFKSTNTDCATPLLILADERAKSGNNTLFDMNLRRSFDLYTEYPEIDYPDMNTVWDKFDHIFETLSMALRYVPVFVNFHNRLLQELVDDNIMYVEIRSSMGNLYDDDREYEDRDAAKIYNDVMENFKQIHPKFIGAKFIYSIYRKMSQEKLEEKMKRFKLFQETYPKLVIGFDLVGQEDFGEPLYKFLPQLLKLSQDTNFFFHAGETNWYGTSTDLNVLDAILLRTKRIGHGYSLVKHPLLWKHLKDYEIAIELNPLSNQILGLVHDLRNHPGAVFMAENIPIVVTADDPGFWRSTGLSYDFYYAYMAFSPYDAGLEVLKQLVLNSIKFSILTEEERSRADKLFEEQWAYFINELVDGKIV